MIISGDKRYSGSGCRTVWSYACTCASLNDDGRVMGVGVKSGVLYLIGREAGNLPRREPEYSNLRAGP